MCVFAHKRLNFEANWRAKIYWKSTYQKQACCWFEVLEWAAVFNQHDWWSLIPLCTLEVQKFGCNPVGLHNSSFIRCASALQGDIFWKKLKRILRINVFNWILMRFLTLRKFICRYGRSLVISSTLDWSACWDVAFLCIQGWKNHDPCK